MCNIYLYINMCVCNINLIISCFLNYFLKTTKVLDVNYVQKYYTFLFFFFNYYCTHIYIHLFKFNINSLHYLPSMSVYIYTHVSHYIVFIYPLLHRKEKQLTDLILLKGNIQHYKNH